MFILILTYQKPISEVEKFLDAHNEFLDTNYKLGVFIASGKQNPRIGGVILCKAQNREQVQLIIEGDPFYSNKIAEYDVIEFEPTKYIPAFKKLI